MQYANRFSIFQIFFYLVIFVFSSNSYPQAQSLKYTYDELGRLKTVEDSKNGDRNYQYDAAGNRIYVENPTVAVPKFTPSGGPFPGPVMVSISSQTTNAIIRYSVDGSAITSSSTLYTAPFQVINSGTIKAKAFKQGVADSPQATADFEIQYPAAAPSMSPNGGEFYISTSVTLATSTSGATIRYTRDGSDVTQSSPVYSSPFTLTSSAIVKAKAFKVGMTGSLQSQAAFVITPLIASPTGLSSLPVTLTGTTGMYESKWNPVPGATYYILRKIDSSETNVNGTSAIQTSRGMWVKACTAVGCSQAANFPAEVVTVAEPVFNPNGGTFAGSATIAISSSTVGATIRYTLDGSDVTVNSSPYTGQFQITNTATVKAKAYKSGATDSPQTSAVFSIQQPAGAPDISPSGGTFVNSVVVTLSPVTAGSTIRYSINGSDVTTSSTLYSTPFTLTGNATVKARAYKSGSTDSAQSSAVFVVQQTVATPTISPNGGTFDLSAQVTLNSSTAGATIRYTTNGSNVTSSSLAYSAPLSLTATTTIKARAFKTGMVDSLQASATFTVTPLIAAPTGLSTLPRTMTGTTGMYESKWSAVQGASHYIFKTLSQPEASTTSTMSVNPSKGWWVKACNAVGCSQPAYF